MLLSALIKQCMAAEPTGHQSPSEDMHPTVIPRFIITKVFALPLPLLIFKRWSYVIAYLYRYDSLLKSQNVGSV